jgi:hypothetical protein
MGESAEIVKVNGEVTPNFAAPMFAIDRAETFPRTDRLDRVRRFVEAIVHISGEAPVKAIAREILVTLDSLGKEEVDVELMG